MTATDRLARELETARHLVAQYDELLATIHDPTSHRLINRYRAFWLAVIERLRAEMAEVERHAPEGAS